MTIQTRNKRKNWQAELGTNAHKVFCKRSLSGLPVPVKWALRDQVMGIDRPSYGHSLPVLRASSAQSVERFWALFTGRRLRYYAWCFMRISWCSYADLVILPCQFHDTLRLFFTKKLFSCAYKLDEKSKKYLIWNLINSPKITSRRRLYYMAT